MQMTTEARAWLDATVKRILARHPLGDAERAGITYELMSHLHAAGEARATAAGRGEVAREDLEAALLEAGGEDKLAAAFVQPLARPVQRVLFGRRAGAFALDAFLLGIALGFVHGALTYFLEPVLGAQDPPSDVFRLLWVLPWGYHPMVAPALQALVALASGALVLGYFAWTEARDGRSLGKRMLDLRVVRVDGTPLAGRDAVVRNLAKLVPVLLAADVLLMLLAFAEDKQRLSDRLAKTLVVRA